MDKELKDYLDIQFEKINNIFNNIDDRFDNIDNRINNIDNRIDNIDKQLIDIRRTQLEQINDDSTKNILESYDRRIKYLESKVC